VVRPRSSSPRHAATVHLVVRDARLDENMSRYLADRILHAPRIRLHLHTEVRFVEGEPRRLRAVVVQDTVTRALQRLPARDVMVFIGGTPSSSCLADAVTVYAGGYVVTDQRPAATPVRVRIRGGRVPAAAARDRPAWRDGTAGRSSPRRTFRSARGCRSGSASSTRPTTSTGCSVRRSAVPSTT
jgi:thioredoxin reductase (NADPH)